MHCAATAPENEPSLPEPNPGIGIGPRAGSRCSLAPGCRPTWGFPDCPGGAPSRRGAEIYTSDPPPPPNFTQPHLTAPHHPNTPPPSHPHHPHHTISPSCSSPQPTPTPTPPIPDSTPSNPTTHPPHPIPLGVGGRGGGGVGGGWVGGWVDGWVGGWVGGRGGGSVIMTTEK
jgi:hypothetical protein